MKGTMKRLCFLSLVAMSLVSCAGVSSSELTSSSASSDDGMDLIWSDEFDGNSLDTDYWSYDLGGGGWGNSELEYYTKDNATVNDGVLTIEAKRESDGGCSFTSSRIKTIRKAYTTYGRIEARIKLSGQNAMWPAFWMMPENNNGWPLSGEIDIMENKGSDAYTTSSALHYVNSNGQNDYSYGSYSWSKRSHEGSIEDWHLYYVDWDENEFDFYVDNHLKLTVPKRAWHPANDKIYPTSDDAPFNKDFYIILNMAVGGNFDSGRKPNSDFVSAKMQVDYVRMYQWKE